MRYASRRLRQRLTWLVEFMRIWYSGEETEVAYRRAIELDPKDADPWTGLGIWLADQSGRGKEVEAAYCKAMQLNPSNPHPLANLARLLAALGRHPEASTAYRQTVALAQAADAGVVAADSTPVTQGFAMPTCCSRPTSGSATATWPGRPWTAWRSPPPQATPAPFIASRNRPGSTRVSAWARPLRTRAPGPTSSSPSPWPWGPPRRTTPRRLWPACHPRSALWPRRFWQGCFPPPAQARATEPGQGGELAGGKSGAPKQWPASARERHESKP